MTTTPRSPTPKRRAVAWLLRAAVLAALGGAIYYGLEVADDLVIDRLAEQDPLERIEVVELPDLPAAPRGSSEGRGNGLVRRSAFALDSHRSITAKVIQNGWIDGEPIATTGEYHQLGGGQERSFLLKQSGQLAGLPTRLLRVSNSRFLWTDMTWGSDPAEPSRSITRVDLRLVRRALKEHLSASTASDPSAWSRFGGLPMLLSGLDSAFTFGPSYAMQLRGERVLAMVGRWRPERLAELSEAGTLPPHAPQHVVLALSDSTLFPRLLEYRDYRDPLSAEGLADQELLKPSRRPLLKIELEHQPGAPPQDERMFTYRSNDEGWSDQTERELRLVRQRYNGVAVATPPTSSGLRR